MQKRYDQLNFVEEKRLAAICHGQLYQRRLIQSYGKKVRAKIFQEGDLVLKKIILRQGPYVVKKAFSGGALVLTNMDGDELENPINSDAVRKYYA
ncbi:hypothetical protein M5689_024632 [Euphorbia peplus]|nr:hypothetical protein M5689_024632 [Euphorbia peplus]